MAEARYLDLTEPPGEPRLSIVAPLDFTFADAGEADARLVLDRANVSLYCLDPENRRALFAETDPAADLIKAPFLYHAQHQAARRLVAVPYDLLKQPFGQVQIPPVTCLMKPGQDLVRQPVRRSALLAALSSLVAYGTGEAFHLAQAVGISAGRWIVFAWHGTPKGGRC